ncbi:MarR family winged helix-turn-helix transcriptional regulator [Marinobacterium rhizophilum]|uniref:MarR family transcriptional regulator n=1 Tax=Marinobacterium rhizophilum TaxID=420402 RepID=A0ABY5HPE0_9GAMM|nr:MarR family transcriptional regulator [Marinobacterium rhizophilum]UTW13097.1 MarR family transcriptional regulator [Marinobacterium rhizophilum]
MTDSPIGEALHQLLHAYKRAMQQSYQAHGIDFGIGHIRSLKVIRAHQASPESPCTAQQIVARLQRDKAQIARLVKDLLAAELIDRHDNPDDRRSQILRLTPAGEAMLRRIQDAEQHASLRLSRGLSQDDLHSFIRLAKSMTGNLKP